MDDIETTNSVDDGALPAAEADLSRAGGTELEGAASRDIARAEDEPTLDEYGNPIGDEERPDGEEELEEIERQGKKAKIPSWLKPELMMQADYTRKTQELAEARRAFEAERSVSHHATQTERAAEANLALIDQQIGAFSTIDWNGWHDSEPFGAQKAFAQYQLLKDARAQTLAYLGSVQQERTFRAQQETARRLEQGVAELTRDISDWSPQTAAKLLDFGQSHYGFSREDLDGIDDPRLVKVLHAAFQWEEHRNKQRQAQKHAAAQAARPAERVGGASPKPGLDDRLSADEWLRRRNEQLRKKRG